jgi:hypothetical protein
MPGHVRFELRNVVANYPFEKSRRLRRFSRILATETIRGWAAALGIRSSGWVLPGFARTLAIMRRIYRPRGSETAARSALAF